MDEVMDRVILQATLEGLLAQEKRIQNAISDTRAKLGHPMVGPQLVSRSEIPDIPRSAPTRKTLSEEARKRIAAAQKKRWAKRRKDAKPEGQ